MPHQFLPDIRINTPNDLHTVLLAFRANKNILNAITREYVHLLTAPMDMPDGRYIIHEAALGGHVYLIRAIIKQAAMAHPAIDMANMRDDRGWTPMHYVCNFSDSRYLAAARVLVEYPPAIGRNAANVGAANNDGTTPMLRAAFNGNLAIVTYLLGAVDVNAANNKGLTALHFAALGGHIDIAEALINHGANVFAKDIEDDTPLETANIAMVRLLRTAQYCAHLREWWGDISAADKVSALRVMDSYVFEYFVRLIGADF